MVEQGAPPLADLEFIHESDAANLYVFPEEADYTDRRPLAPTWHRMDSSVRETDDDYVVPAAVADRPEGSALVYVSLGSLGGADVDLMRRLVDVLGRTPHRYIVSKGPQADLIELADNMVGAEFLPQTKVIPQVDLVITHGGNNTTTEALHFGKPMILLPLFWDQYDNAQRMDELGFGVRLPTYAFTDEDMVSALDRLLGDADLRDRMARTGAAIRARDGLRRGADVIEQVGKAHAGTRVSADGQALLASTPAASLLPSRRAEEAARIAEPLRLLAQVTLAEGVEYLLVEDARGVAYGVPAVAGPRGGVGRWPGTGPPRRSCPRWRSDAQAQDGLELTVFHAEPARGERAIDVDQTNELVVVGDAAVVKWMLHPVAGDQPGPRRLTTLARAGFDGTPRTWGLVHLPVAGERVLIATVSDYLPGAEDGWDWAVRDVRQVALGRAQRGRVPRRGAAGRAAGGPTPPGPGRGRDRPGDARRCGRLARRRRGRPRRRRTSTPTWRERCGHGSRRSAAARGRQTIDVHGDLHIGQVLAVGEPREYVRHRLRRQPHPGRAARACAASRPPATWPACSPRGTTWAGSSCIAPRASTTRPSNASWTGSTAPRRAFLETYRARRWARPVVPRSSTSRCSSPCRCSRSAGSTPTPPGTFRTGGTCPMPPCPRC